MACIDIVRSGVGGSPFMRMVGAFAGAAFSFEVDFLSGVFRRQPSVAPLLRYAPDAVLIHGVQEALNFREA